LKIKIMTKAAWLPDAPEISFNVPDGDIKFEVTRRANGVDTYEPGPFDRNRLHDRRDFRWVLDFEGPELHDQRLPLRDRTLERSVFVFNGLFYTRDTEEVIIKRPSPILHPGGGLVGSEFILPKPKDCLITKSIGCDIHLVGREEFVFRYGPNADYSIRLKKEPEISYEISVTNLCTEDVDLEGLGRTDFALYYEVLNVPENEQFQVFSAIQAADDVNPCDPGRLSLTNAPLG